MADVGRLLFDRLGALLQCFGRLTFAVRQPARRTQQEADRIRHALRVEHVLPETDPVLHFDDDRVMRGHRRRQTVDTGLIGALFDVGAEQAIEDDQHAAEVRIEIGRVRCMVHTMRRRRVEHIFEPAELRNPRCVQPELIEQVDRHDREHHIRLHAEPHERSEEDGRSGDLGQPAETKRGRQRQLVRRVMDRVIRPEEADRVRRAVIPVVAELLSDEEQEERERGVRRDRVDAMLPREVENRRRERDRHEREQLAADEVGERDPGLVPVEGTVGALVLEVQDDGFDQRRGENDAHRVQRDFPEQFQFHDGSPWWVVANEPIVAIGPVKNHAQTISWNVMDRPQSLVA
ncbi:protein of unknown function (plasmid) [Caballeronia sp. S22]